MQLNRRTRITGALASATSALLSQAPREAIAAEEWDIDTSLLIYSEDDSRVSDVSFKSLANKTLGDDDTVTVGLQVDSLTGATPSGAVPLDQPQTFTRPSGEGSYTIEAGETPLDDTFKDSRVSLNGSWTHATQNESRYSFGGSFSREYDYLHLGVNTSYAKDINNKNTTLSVGAALSQDQSDPVGGAPVAFSDVIASSRELSGGEEKGGSEDKTLIDLMFGVTQIINRRSLFQVNYSLGMADGYMNDPYKFLSVLDSTTGDAVAGAAPDSFLYRYESRPDERLGHNLYGGYKYHFDTGIANLSYRFHTDDWGIDSHTVEARYRWLLGNKSYLEPHVRYYTQTAADFYQPFLTSDASLPENASSDYRLAEFDAFTLGIKYSRPVSDLGMLNFRLERYQASGEDHPAEAFGAIEEQDLYPEVGALIAQIGFSFKW